MFNDLTINIFVLRLLSLLLVAFVQGLVVAATAVALGDAGPKYDGDLRIDPVRHLDLLGSISTLFFGIGWSKPVAADPAEFRTGRIGVVAVYLAAFVALLLLAVVLQLLLTPAVTLLPFTAGLAVKGFLRVAAEISFWFALLGLLPIPPLTGGLLLTAFRVRISSQVRWILAVALILAVATNVVGYVLGPAHHWLTSLILGN